MNTSERDPTREVEGKLKGQEVEGTEFRRLTGRSPNKFCSDKVSWTDGAEILKLSGQSFVDTDGPGRSAFVQWRIVICGLPQSASLRTVDGRSSLADGGKAGELLRRDLPVRYELLTRVTAYGKCSGDSGSVCR